MKICLNLKVFLPDKRVRNRFGQDIYPIHFSMGYNGELSSINKKNFGIIDSNDTPKFYFYDVSEMPILYYRKSNER